VNYYALGAIVLGSLAVSFGGALCCAYFMGLLDRFGGNFFDLMDWAYEKGQGKARKK